LLNAKTTTPARLCGIDVFLAAVDLMEGGGPALWDISQKKGKNIYYKADSFVKT
jgi:hypothetical protein